MLGAGRDIPKSAYFKLRPCSAGGREANGGGGRGLEGRGLHRSTFQLNLSRFGHTSPCPPV